MEALTFLITAALLFGLFAVIAPAIATVVGFALWLVLLPLKLVFGLLLLPLKLLAWLIVLPLKLVAGMIELAVFIVLLPVLLLVGGALAVAGVGVFGLLLAVPVVGIAFTVFVIWALCRRNNAEVTAS